MSSLTSHVKLSSFPVCVWGPKEDPIWPTRQKEKKKRVLLRSDVIAMWRELSCIHIQKAPSLYFDGCCTQIMRCGTKRFFDVSSGYRAPSSGVSAVVMHRCHGLLTNSQQQKQTKQNVSKSYWYFCAALCYRCLCGCCETTSTTCSFTALFDKNRPGSNDRNESVPWRYVTL